MRFGLILIIAAVAAGSAGCGQKGPLYLPQKSGTVITRPAGGNTPPAPAQQSDKEKKDDAEQPQ